ncbi:hypothetical protein, partial [Herbaspirillum rubrisubalbicans]|uniref:hypothetical protein n=1 Tax=Herbaspirillum rubrisubalbicans TaxID=80842 RepID=UPI001472471F
RQQEQQKAVAQAVQEGDQREFQIVSLAGDAEIEWIEEAEAGGQARPPAKVQRSYGIGASLSK